MDNVEKRQDSRKKWYLKNKKEILARNKARYEKERGKILEWNQAYYSNIEPRAKAWVATTKRYCDKKNLPFDLNVEYLVSLWAEQDGKCSITSMSMDLKRGEGRKKNSASLDRIVPALGYVKKNIRFVCDVVNQMRSDMSDGELDKWCLRIIQGPRANVVTPNLNSFADAIDRLIVEVSKLSFFENSKREEQGKDNPDSQLIAYYDNLSRDSCEFRSALKNEINRVLREIVISKSYLPLEEKRTFRSPTKSVSDLISEMVENRVNTTAKKELIKAIEEELNELD